MPCPDVVGKKIIYNLSCFSILVSKYISSEKNTKVLIWDRTERVKKNSYGESIVRKELQKLEFGPDPKEFIGDMAIREN